MTKFLPILICICNLAGVALLALPPREKAWLLVNTALVCGVMYMFGRDHGSGDG